MMVGTKGLFAVNSFVVPIMVCFSLMLMTLSIKQPNFINHLLFIPHAEDGWKSILAPFSYAALNLGLSASCIGSDRE